jgi:hypothetical protein
VIAAILGQRRIERVGPADRQLHQALWRRGAEADAQRMLRLGRCRISHHARRKSHAETNAFATSAIESVGTKVEQCLDDALADSFPASDPISFLQASPVRKGDEPLCTVKVNGRTETKRSVPSRSVPR